MQDITVHELKERKDRNEHFMLIDVREPFEHEEFDIGGENLPLGEIMSWSEELQVSPDAEIIVYCRSGNRSAMAKSFLTSKGFTSIRNLIGGVVAWQKM
ncbi:MAG TPA: rhodanese-like domain-containing protein [Saprospiraceae bacterium]|nr:rhodanese-like domain-containing protein [Saprospiraceae bacterium]